MRLVLSVQCTQPWVLTQDLSGEGAAGEELEDTRERGDGCRGGGMVSRAQGRETSFRSDQRPLARTQERRKQACMSGGWWAGSRLHFIRNGLEVARRLLDLNVPKPN